MLQTCFFLKEQMLQLLFVPFFDMAQVLPVYFCHI